MKICDALSDLVPFVQFKKTCKKSDNIDMKLGSVTKFDWRKKKTSKKKKKKKS